MTTSSIPLTHYSPGGGCACKMPQSLLCVPPAKVSLVVTALRDRGDRDATVIGELVDGSPGRVAVDAHGSGRIRSSTAEADIAGGNAAATATASARMAWRDGR
jgi:hypothetical protein